MIYVASRLRSIITVLIQNRDPVLHWQMFDFMVVHLAPIANDN